MQLDLRIPATALAITTPYLVAKLEGNRREALRLAVEQGLERGVSAAELELHMIVPAQREVGRLWEENRISVAQEHLATSISQLVLAHLYEHLPRPATNGLRALVACTPGELHDLGARIGADFLEMAGFQVQFMGANVATERLVEVVQQERPHLLGLSATMSFHLPALRATIAAVRAVSPKLPIVVGGGLLESTHGLGDSLGVEAFGRSAEELARTCVTLLRATGTPTVLTP
jgi:MerR family transcriptional regulator, light-induced transcriptional regulator